MKKLKTRDEWLAEGHSYDKEIDNARMMQGSAAELVQWAERKIAESRPENFKEGVISPIRETKVNERRKPITKKHWDKADDDQRVEWLLQAFSDPNDAEKYFDYDWNELPDQATSNMYESVVNEAKIKVTKKDIKDIEDSGNIDIAYKKAMALLTSLVESVVTEAVKEVVLSNEILDFLEERGILKGSDAQKIHKDLTAFLKKNLNESVATELVGEATMQEIDKKVQRFVIKNAKDYEYSNQDSAFQIYLSLKKLYPRLIKESVNEDSVNEWKLQLDLGNVNPSEFGKWANDPLQKKHKIKISGSGKNWTIVGNGNDDRKGSSADFITQLLGKAFTINKINVVQTESVNEAKFTYYDNNELAAYVKNNPKDKEAAKELHKRSQKIKDLSRTDESNLSEGQFSWLTHDGKVQIGSDPMNRVVTYMYDDKGNKWEEKHYEGYGEFGGKDYYDLVATMNGYTEEDLKDKKLLKKARVIGKPELRQLGIAIAFDNLKPKTGKKPLFPALVTDPRYNWKRHDFEEEAESDPNQGWYDDEYGDDEYGYYESTNESLKGKLKALYKAAQKKFGKTKIVPPNDADYETAEKYIAMEYGEGHSLFAIGVDKIQDVINIQVGDDKTRETEDIVIDRPATNEADEWSDDVKTKWTPPAGLFTEPANKIADVLHKESDDLSQAMSRLQFYINRGGKLLDAKAKANLETAKKLLQQKYA